jgi:hypothetical protein
MTLNAHVDCHCAECLQFWMVQFLLDVAVPNVVAPFWGPVLQNFLQLARLIYTKA